MATLYRTQKRQFLPLIVFFCVFTLFKQAPLQGALDLLTLISLIGMGVILMKATRRDYPRLVRSMVPISLFLSATVVICGLCSWWFGYTENFLTWAFQEVKSLPSGVAITETLGIEEDSFLRIHANALVGAYGGALTLLLFTNLVFDNFLKSMRELARTKKMAKTSIWDVFANWKTPDLSLIILLLGLSSLAAHFKFYKGEFSDLAVLSMVGWSSLVWALFCYILDGLAVAAYFLQRVTMPFKLLIILMIYLFQIPLLAIVGLGDLWFDFRSRIRSNQADSDDNE